MPGEIKFSQLPTGSAIGDSDFAPWVQGGTNVKQAASAIKTYLQNSGNFLLSANNLSDVSNIRTSAQNLGLRNGYLFYSDNGPTLLPNPLPRFIAIGHTSSQTFKFPDKSLLNVNSVSDIYFINNYSNFDQTFLNSDGDTVFVVKSNSNYIYTAPDILSPNWYDFPVPASLQQIYDISSPPQIKFGAGSGLSFINSTSDNLFIISDTFTSCFKPFLVSQNGADGLSVILTDDPNSTFFQIKSTTYGSISDPVMTNTERDSINITGNPIGLGIFNSTTKTRDYYDGISWQKILTTQNVSGSGTVTVTDNGDGTIDVFGSGGAPVPEPSFAAYSVINNSAPRPAVGGSFVAVPVSSGFTDVSDQNFTSQTMIIAGVNTVGSTYTGSVITNFMVTQAVSMRPTASSFVEYYYAIAILRADTSIETTNYRAYVSRQNVLLSVPATMTGVIELSQGDTVFTQIYCAASTGNDPTYTITSKVASVAGSIPNTDGLPQGTSNIYLSQNGGSTFQFMNGSGTVGHYASFNSTGGQLTDSGVAIGRANTSAVTTNSVFYPIFVGSNTANNQAINTATGLSFNPNTGILTSVGLNLSGLGLANTLIATDSANNLTTNLQNAGGNIGQLNIAHNFTPLIGNQSAMTFDSSLLYGNYLQFGGLGSYLGIESVNNGLFLSGSLKYDATALGYVYANNGTGALFLINEFGIQLQHAISGTSGNPATPITDFSVDSSGNINLPHLTASQAVVTDSGKNLASLAYTSANTVSTLVARDSSGNFSAGTITATLSGNASTATTSTNANNVATTQVTNNASYFPLMVSSSVNGNQAPDLSTGFTFNPSNNTLSAFGLNLSGLTGTSPVFTDSGKNLTSSGTVPFANGGFGFSTATTGDIFYASGTNTPGKLSDVATGSVLVSGGVGVVPAYSSAPSVSTAALTGGGGSTSALVLGASASAISGTTPIIDISSNYSDASYLRFGTNGALGVTNSGRQFFTKNLDYDGTTGTYKYMTSAFGYAIELSVGGFIVSTAPSGTAGNTATMTTVLSATNGSAAIAGTFSIANVAGAALAGTTPSFSFGSSLSDGNYINLGGSGKNIGATSSGNTFFSNNLDWNATSNDYHYSASAAASVIELGTSSGALKYAPSGTAGNSVTPSTSFSWDTSGNINLPNLSASALVATDGSKNLTSTVSGLSPGFTGLNLSGLTASSMVVTDGSKNLASAALPLGINAIVASNTATQSMSLQTIYLVTYAGGQMVGTLPAATGTGKTIQIIGASTASTSGWRVNAAGSDTIQFNAAVSAGGGNIVSTTSSATDCATFIDSASGKWLVYPAQGLNLIVT